MPALKDITFLLLSGFTLISAAGVTFSRKIVYSGFSLLGTLFGVAGLFVMLSSDFVAVTQVLIYVGGILVLILFAIMLTSKIGDMKLTNQSVNGKVAIPIMAGIAFFMITQLTGSQWKTNDVESYQSLLIPIGNAFLKEYLLPFEIISIVLLGALVGAMVIVKKEAK